METTSNRAEGLSALLALPRILQGPSVLRDPSYGVDEGCQSTARIEEMLRGKAARVDYEWEYRGEPQEGSLVVSVDAGSDVATLFWLDTWHTGPANMLLTGEAAGKRIFATGSYGAPTGPDWGWRIELETGPATLRLIMYNISPEGEEELAVESKYAS